MKNDGIKLDLDADGQAYIVEEDGKETCVADIACQHVKRTETDGMMTMSCHLKPQAVNVFTLEKCPANKWHKYIDVRSSTDMDAITAGKGCFACGSKKQWRLKGGKWICSNCHPPNLFTKKQIETRTYKKET